MADLTQNVKYVVTVDTAALEDFRTKLNDLHTTLGKVATEMKTFGDRAGTTARTIGRLSASMTTNAASMDRQRQAFDNLKGSQAAMDTTINALKGNISELATSMRELSKAAKHMGTVQNALTKDQKKLGDETEASGKKAGVASTNFLRLFGTFFASRYLVKETFDFIKEGAQSLDLDRTLGRQLGNFGQLMADIRKQTAGMVADADLKKSVALMTSFGISTEGMADAMGLVQKMAIRTGQDAAFLTDSFARAVSRRSVLIADNLGIQLTLTEADEAYATRIGKTAQELTAREQVLAFQTFLLEKMRENTEGIDLEAASGGTVARAGALVENIINKLKEFGATALVTVDMLFSSAASSANYAADQVREWAVQAKDAGTLYGITEEQFRKIADIIDAMGKSEAVADLFGDQGIFGTTPRKINENALAFAQYAAQIDSWFTTGAWRNGANLLANALSPDGRETGTNGKPGGLQIQEQMIAMFAMKFMEEARRSAQEAADAYELQVNAAGQVLSKSERSLFIRQQMNEAEARANALLALTAQQVDDIADKQGMSDSQRNAFMLQRIAMMVHAEGLDTRLLQLAIAQADALVAAKDAQAEINRQIQERVDASTALASLVSTVMEIEEGTLLNQQRYNQAKAELNASLTQMNELQKQFNDEQDAQERARLSRQMYGLLTEINQRKYLADYWRKQHKEQMAGIEKFRNASDAVLKVEIKRLETAAEQLKAQATMLEIMYNVTAQASGKPLTANEIMAITQMQLKAANSSAEAMALAKFLGGGGGGGGGGSSLKEDRLKKHKEDKPSRYASDYIAKLAEQSDIAFTELEKLFVPGKVRGGMFGQSSFLGVDPEQVEKSLEVIRKIRIAMSEYERMSGGDKFMSDADLERLNYAEARMKELARHMERMRDIAVGMTQASSAMASALGGADGIFGENMIAMVSDLTAGLEGMSEAFANNAGAYEMVNASMPLVRAFTQNLIKDMRVRAGFEAAMQAAASWAAFASGNVPGGTMHAIAATLYAGVAGGVIKLPKGKGTGDTAGGDAGASMRNIRRDVHIHITGPIATTEAERGAMIRDAIRAAEREGI